MKLLIYAGIGSRETPEDVQDQMIEIGKFMAQEGWLLRSGAADGADTAFEIGAGLGRGEKQIFLPWRKFNGSSSEYILDQFYREKREEAEEIVSRIHPAWSYLRHAAKKLHTRNVFQILGPSLDEPVALVICWTKKGRVEGGTATAINLARERGIPVFNLALGFYLARSYDSIQKALSISK